MKRPGTFVAYDGRVGVIEKLIDTDAIVRFPSAFPFPTLHRIPVKQLKQQRQQKNIDSYGTATF